MELQPNRYAPPTATVADIEVDKVRPAPCPHIELACRLMWISWGLSTASNVAKVFVATGMFAVVVASIGAVIGAGIGYAITSWVVRKLRAGRNWMRWLLTALNVLGLVMIGAFWDFYRQVIQSLSSNWMLLLTVGASMTIALIVLALLHTPTTRAWFRAHSAAS